MKAKYQVLCGQEVSPSFPFQLDHCICRTNSQSKGLSRQLLV